MEVIILLGGIIFWFTCVLYLTSILYYRVFRKPYNFEKFRGEWAIVTGSSYGIGAEFSRSLAKRGLNVILIARSLDKLNQLATEIEEKYKVKTCCLSIDFVCEKDIQRKVSKVIKDRCISVLINNVGGVPSGTRIYQYFHEYSQEDFDNFRKLNSGAALTMSQAVLPSMISRKKGVILNTGSLSSVVNVYLSPYGSDKAGLNSLTETMALEFAGFGIEVGCALGGKIASPSADGHFNGFQADVVSAEKFAEASLDMFGAQVVYVPFWVHAIQSFFIKNLPRFITQQGIIKQFNILKKDYDALQKTD